ncbi:hypothetical protein DSECCO2_197680 [anaerobic digester metagenome]
MNWRKIAFVGLLIIVLVHVIVNIIMQIRLPWNIVYDGDWLGFFGAFFGAVFTVIGAIYIVHLNTVKENNRSYYIELLEFREAFNKYINNIPTHDFTYESLISNPMSKTILENLILIEKENVNKLHNWIIRLNIFNSNWSECHFT